VVAWFDVESEALRFERALISKIGRFNIGYGPLLNITAGGEGRTIRPLKTRQFAAEKPRAEGMETLPELLAVDERLNERMETLPAVIQADTDARVVELWLDGRNALTVEAYAKDLDGFRTQVGKPLRAVTIGDLQTWFANVGGAPASRTRRLASIKSLMSYACRIGYLQFNPAAAIRSPMVVNFLAERILSEEQVVRLIALETDPRDHALIRLLYIAGLRVSEACGLKWGQTSGRKAGGGQITVLGKRSKVRTVVLPASMWRELGRLRRGDMPEEPVFRSRNGGHLDPTQVQRIVKTAAIRAGLPKDVSPHWLRHAHCSHALERGANPALVRDTVGHADLTSTSRYSHARPNDSSSRYLIG